MVARKLIPIGSEITIEYATFMNEQMAPFKCYCDSKNCCKLIKETDFDLPFMDMYKNHCSEYIKSKLTKDYV